MTDIGRSPCAADGTGGRDRGPDNRAVASVRRGLLCRPLSVAIVNVQRRRGGKGTAPVPPLRGPVSARTRVSVRVLGMGVSNEQPVTVRVG